MRSSVDMGRTSIDDVLASAEAHPFHKEIQQLEKVAEEFGAVAVEVSESEEDEIAYMAARGLLRFGVADYISEIQPLFSEVHAEQHLQYNTTWI